MNLPCKVVEDLLPMYYDCLCAEESATLVEEHLKKCPACSRILAQLQTEFEIADRVEDDLKPLVALRERWQKSKWSNIQKGVCITLAAIVLVIGVLLAGWYFSYGKVFHSLAENMDRTAESDMLITGADHTKQMSGYRFDLWGPTVLNDDGYARVDSGDGLGLFLYPKRGGAYEWKLYIENADGRMWFLHLKKDLTPDFENYDTLLSAEKEKAKVEQLVAEKEEEISAMLETVQKLWHIDLLQYVD